MARSNDESWVLASSVGATATMVAAGRAIATRDPRGLIDDPFAEPLVRAVGIDFFTKMIDGELDITDIDPESAPRVQANIDEVALRTKYFDEYFSRATDVGIRQAVILASGLDSRAYRLPWPDATTVYELDQPDVIEFKTSTLAGIGAVPAAQRRTVSIDLRDDWPAALRAAGFQDGSPTAWLAEGLLIYLPPEAQDRLFDNITALSATGSTIATEYVPGLRNFDPEKARQATEQLPRARHRHRHAVADLSRRAQPRHRLPEVKGMADEQHPAGGTVRPATDCRSGAGRQRSARRNRVRQRHV